MVHTGSLQLIIIIQCRKWLLRIAIFMPLLTLPCPPDAHSQTASQIAHRLQVWRPALVHDSLTSASHHRNSQSRTRLSELVASLMSLSTCPGTELIVASPVFAPRSFALIGARLRSADTRISLSDLARPCMSVNTLRRKEVNSPSEKTTRRAGHERTLRGQT